MTLIKLCFVLLLAGILCACDAPYGPDQFKTRGCTACHWVRIDKAHNIGCTACHMGDAASHSMESAHQGLVRHPASPENMKRFCGKCHEERVKRAAESDHFTLRDEIGYVWKAFFPKGQGGASIPAPQEIRKEKYPWSLQGLVGDMLRKRCLRCHVWYQGDGHEGTRRGTGCAACHLNLESSPFDHIFRQAVDDSQCLSCHYGNFTGWDYYGRFEKDYPSGFRAPLEKGRHIKRTYGVEWLDMTSDVHLQKGMTCSDCHVKGPCESANATETVTCVSCHELSVLSSRPGHTVEAASSVSCTVCHAVWAPVEIGRSLMRQDRPDYEEWLRLSVQNSLEVEKLCQTQSALKFEAWQPAVMEDKIDHSIEPGMWFEGFVARRFWPVMAGITSDGRMVNVRPLLDISISYVDSDEMIMADNIQPVGVADITAILPDFSPGPDFISFLRPELYEKPWLWLEFTPHTIGPADVFRTIRVNRWLEERDGE